MSESKSEPAANYRKLPEHTRFKKGQSGNPRGRPAKNLPALLAAALNEKVTVTENGKRRQVTKREPVIAQLQIGLGRAAGHQDADRYAPGYRKESRADSHGKIPVQPDRQRGRATADRQAAPQHVRRRYLPRDARRAGSSG